MSGAGDVQPRRRAARGVRRTPPDCPGRSRSRGRPSRRSVTARCAPGRAARAATSWPRPRRVRMNPRRLPSEEMTGVPASSISVGSAATGQLGRVRRGSGRRASRPPRPRPPPSPRIGRERRSGGTGPCPPAWHGPERRGRSIDARSRSGPCARRRPPAPPRRRPRRPRGDAPATPPPRAAAAARSARTGRRSVASRTRTTRPPALRTPIGEPRGPAPIDGTGAPARPDGVARRPSTARTRPARRRAGMPSGCASPRARPRIRSCVTRQRTVNAISRRPCPA